MGFPVDWVQAASIPFIHGACVASYLAVASAQMVSTTLSIALSLEKS